MKATHALLAKVKFETFHNPSQAKLQYESYKRILQECDLEIIEVDIGEKLILEDMLVVCNGTAIVPSVESQKRDHIKPLINQIEKILVNDLGQTVIPLKDPGSSFRGTDFLFTGQEIFVGITSRTNMKAATEIANLLKDYPCTTLRIENDAILKRHITMAGDNVICVSTHPAGQNILKMMQKQAQYSYKTLTVDDQETANCMYVNGTLIHRGIEEVPADFHTICKKIGYPRRSACFYALATQDINLTSNCLLFDKRPAVVKTNQL